MRGKDLSDLQQYYDEGTDLLRKGKYSAANQVLTHALKIALERDQLLFAALIGSYLALVEDGIANSELAIRMAKMAAKGSESLGNAEAMFVCYRNLALVYRNHAKFSLAEVSHKRSLVAAREAGNRRFETIALTDIAELRADLGDGSVAIGLYREALNATTDQHERAHWTIAIANLHADLGQIEEAMNYYALAEDLAQNAGNLHFEGRVYVNRGLTLLKIGEYEHADTNLQRALAIAKETADSSLECECLNYLGSARYNLGQVMEAIGHYEQALSLAAKTNDQKQMSALLANLAAIRQGLASVCDTEESFEKGRECLEKATETAKQVQQYAAMEICLSNLAILHALRGNVDQAARLLFQARDSAERREDRFQLAMIYCELGLLRSDMGEIKEAKESLEQALDLARQTQHVEVIVKGSYALGRILDEYLGDPRSAHLCYITAREYVGAIRSVLFETKHKQWLQFQYSRIYDSDLIVCCRLAEHGAEYFPEILDITEQSKARILADTIAQGGAVKANEPSGAWEKDGSFRIESAQPFAAKQLHEYLDRSTLVLYFHLLPDRYLLCGLLDASGFRMRPHLIPVLDVWRVVSDIHIALNELGDYPTKSRQTRFQDCLASLWETLLSKSICREIDKVGASRLLIIPDGPLYNIPLHALFNQTTGCYLIDLFQQGICYAPSLMVYNLCLKRKPSRRTGKAVIFANPTLDLPGTEFEIEIAKKHFPEVEVFAGQKATIDEFVKSTPEYDVVWFAGHGVFIAQNPLSSYLRFSNGNLTARDILERQIVFAGNPLFIMSCCETGQFSATAGREVLGLPGTCMQAGVSSLVASMWRVQDAAAARFLSSFCEAWKTDELGDKAFALRTAVGDLRKDSQFNSPYLWAPFYIMGSPCNSDDYLKEDRQQCVTSVLRQMKNEAHSS